MGIAVGDLLPQGNGRSSQHEVLRRLQPLYRNDGEARNLAERELPEGIAEPTIPFLGWGTAISITTTTGTGLLAVEAMFIPRWTKQDWGTTWAQRPLLFRN